MPRVPMNELVTLASDHLVRAGAAEEAARLIAGTCVRSEAEGNPACGLYYVPVLAEQVAAGRIDGRAEPVIGPAAPGVIRADAADGFAHLAIARAMPVLVGAAREVGVASLAVRRSTNALALSHLAIPLAEAGLIGLVVANAPAAMAAPGGRRPVLGTNPLALAVPGPDGPLIVIDQSASAVTKTAVIVARERGEPIPEGWALDAEGRPTTDPAAGLAGTMVPAGGTKGFNVALVVEVLAAALTGAAASHAAAPFSGTEGPPARTGQLLLALCPEAHGAGTALRDLAAALAAEPGTRLPGARRAAAYAEALREGVEVPQDMLAAIKA